MEQEKASESGQWKDVSASTISLAPDCATIPVLQGLWKT